MTEKGGKKVDVKISKESEHSAEDSGTAIEEHKTSAPVAVTDVQPPHDGASAETVRDPLEEAQEKASENRDRWLRAVAELENYKKRTLQEKTRLLKYKNEELLRDLLPVIDNLRRAVHHCGETSRSDRLLDGLKIVSDMFREILGKYGVTEIEALGKPFDPQFHEALARVNSPGTEPNLVVEELEKGYMYHDRLLRPSKVAISA